MHRACLSFISITAGYIRIKKPKGLLLFHRHHCWDYFSALRVEAENAPLCVTPRLFRITTKTPGAFLSASPKGVRYMDVSHKRHSSCLDWYIFSHNRGGYEKATDPRVID